MNSGFLLDTNIISNLVRQPDGIATQKLRENSAAYLCTSIVVACELRFGAEKANSDLLRERIEQILARLEILPLDAPVDSIYGRIRHDLESKGTPIGPNDLLIAAHALAHNLTLVTDNTGEFSRVEGLFVENWIRQ